MKVELLPEKEDEAGSTAAPAAQVSQAAYTSSLRPHTDAHEAGSTAASAQQVCVSKVAYTSSLRHHVLIA